MAAEQAEANSSDSNPTFEKIKQEKTYTKQSTIISSYYEYVWYFSTIITMGEYIGKGSLQQCNTVLGVPHV